MAEPVPSRADTAAEPEPRPVEMRPLLLTALGVLVLIGVSAVWSYGLLMHRAGHVSGMTQPGIDVRQIPASPRLETRPAESLPAYLRREHQRLDHYRWIDRERGVVQIPIEDAMTLLIQRSRAKGEPARGAAQ